MSRWFRVVVVVVVEGVELRPPYAVAAVAELAENSYRGGCQHLRLVQQRLLLSEQVGQVGPAEYLMTKTATVVQPVAFHRSDHLLLLAKQTAGKAVLHQEELLGPLLHGLQHLQAYSADPVEQQVQPDPQDPTYRVSL